MYLDVSTRKHLSQHYDGMLPGEACLVGFLRTNTSHGPETRPHATGKMCWRAKAESLL
jgi:hypothetical protein